MARILYLVRHAKSDWSVPGQSDFDRALNKRGLFDAPLMGKILKELHVKPDLAISSPALRAKTTAEYISEQLEYPLEKISYDEEIYEASPRTLLRLINNLDDKNKSVMLFGHNPTFTYLAEYLSKEQLDNIPTAGAVKLHFEFDSWSLVTEGSAEMIWFEYPKKYKT